MIIHENKISQNLHFLRKRTSVCAGTGIYGFKVIGAAFLDGFRQHTGTLPQGTRKQFMIYACIDDAGGKTTVGIRRRLQAAYWVCQDPVNTGWNHNYRCGGMMCIG